MLTFLRFVWIAVLAIWQPETHGFVSLGMYRSIPSRTGQKQLLSTIEGIHEEVQAKHDKDARRGFDTFGRPKKKVQPTALFSDDDFDVFSVGTGNAGPTEAALNRGTDIFRTKEPVISEEECRDLIQEAQEVIAQSRSNDAMGQETEDAKRGRERTNSELNEAKVSDLPRGKKWLKELLHTKLFPMLESRFGVDAASLTLNDALIIGYIGPSRSQPIHRDASLLSLQIALSPISNYAGGGTYFEAFDAPIKMDQGHVLCHSSGSMHAGRGVDTGERWILVLFAISEKEPQLARLCHAEGVDAMDQHDLTRAELCYRAGLEIAPNDHLLRMSLASCYSKQRDDKKAREQLRLAQTYELCSKAYATHGNLMLSMSRPRAALRYFDMALQRIGDRDLLPDAWTPLRAMGWEMRVQAGRCACLCAEKDAERHANGSDRDWTRRNLPVAIKRLQCALTSAPGHPPLVNMIGRADELLSQSESLTGMV